MILANSHIQRQNCLYS